MWLIFHVWLCMIMLHDIKLGASSSNKYNIAFLKHIMSNNVTEPIVIQILSAHGGEHHAELDTAVVNVAERKIPRTEMKMFTLLHTKININQQFITACKWQFIFGTMGTHFAYFQVATGISHVCQV